MSTPVTDKSVRGGSSTQGKKDQWVDNIHLKLELQDNLVKNYKDLSESSKFIDFVHHVENQKRVTYQGKIQEILMM
jgi:hypothetical protein